MSQLPLVVILNAAGKGTALVKVQDKHTQRQKDFLIKLPMINISEDQGIVQMDFEEFLPPKTPSNKIPRGFIIVYYGSDPEWSAGFEGEKAMKFNFVIDLKNPQQLSEIRKLNPAFDSPLGYQPESERLVSALSRVDLAAQREFFTSLSDEEVALLYDYKQGSTHITLRGQRNFLSESDKSENHWFPFFKGLTDEQWILFRGLVRKAPVLTKEINVYRGVNTPSALNINGKGLISTSTSVERANQFLRGEKCCLIEIKIAPGVKIIGIDLCTRFQYRCEAEIVVCPPYIFTITGGTETRKQATITPGMPAGRRKTARHRRGSTRRSQFIPIYR